MFYCFLFFRQLKVLARENIGCSTKLMTEAFFFFCRKVCAWADSFSFYTHNKNLPTFYVLQMSFIYIDKKKRI